MKKFIDESSIYKFNFYNQNRKANFHQTNLIYNIVCFHYKKDGNFHFDIQNSIEVLYNHSYFDYLSHR